MLTEEQLDHLRSNNELLQLELDDLELIIKQREQELNKLRESAEKVKELQSRLDMNLIEFEQYQMELLKEKKQTHLQSERLKSMEEELFQTIQQQIQQEKEIQALKSVKADLDFTESELKEADKCYEALRQAHTELGKTKSLLELAQIEIQNLKDNLLEQQGLIFKLRQKKFQ